MLIDEGHPQLSMVFLMIREALEQRCEEILLHREESQFSVTYCSGPIQSERDQVKNRHWHNLLAALHSLAGTKAFYHPEKIHEVGITKLSDTEYNTILISETVPELRNGNLDRIRETQTLPIKLYLSFTDTTVRMTIEYP